MSKSNLALNIPDILVPYYNLLLFLLIFDASSTISLNSPQASPISLPTNIKPDVTWWPEAAERITTIFHHVSNDI